MYNLVPESLFEERPIILRDWAVSCQCAGRLDEPIHRECEGQQGRREGGESWRFDAEATIWNSDFKGVGISKEAANLVNEVCSYTFLGCKEEQRFLLEG